MVNLFKRKPKAGTSGTKVSIAHEEPKAINRVETIESLDLSGNITDHFTWHEALRSAKADELGVDNTPDNPGDVECITLTAQRMEAVRTFLGAPIVPTSWYRNLIVNAAVRGVLTSQHKLGEAVDFYVIGMTRDQALALLRPAMHKLGIDQLIREPSWIHVSFITHPSKKGRVPRNQYLDLT